jgi:hypothetical protein
MQTRRYVAQPVGLRSMRPERSSAEASQTQ